MNGITKMIAATSFAVLMCIGATDAMSQETQAKLTEAQRLERLLVSAQKICPVTGKGLTSMGGSVKAKLGDRTLYLCCKGCLKGKIDPQHAEQIEKNLIAAQGKCPIMGKELPADPKSTVVEGRKVFVCCPPCTEKIKGEPKRHLATVNKLLAENLSDRREAGSARR